MLTATRLTYRINRFEVRAILVATGLSVVVSAIVLWWLRNSGYAACIAASGPPRSPASNSRISAAGRPGSRPCPGGWQGSSRSLPACSWAPR